jgi:hypothetical protein
MGYSDLPKKWIMGYFQTRRVLVGAFAVFFGFVSFWNPFLGRNDV